jgi:peptide/nickel transport system substrate-binding protein
VENIDPLGSMGLLRFNFMYPPFNNQKMRQAILYALDQNDYVLGSQGREERSSLAIRISPAAHRSRATSAPSR